MSEPITIEKGEYKFIPVEQAVAQFIEDKEYLVLYGGVEIISAELEGAGFALRSYGGLTQSVDLTAEVLIFRYLR